MQIFIKTFVDYNMSGIINKLHMPNKKNDTKQSIYEAVDGI